jgi:hypothetical protein
MKNVKMEVKGDVLTITVNLKQSFGKSKSGKSEVIASTGGNTNVPGREEKIGLNVYRGAES